MTVVTYNGVETELQAPVDDHIHKAWKTGKFYEADLLDAIRARNLHGVYVDVGAHVGNHTVFFAQHCRSTKVYAFEANGAVIQYLRTNALQLAAFGTKHFCRPVQVDGRAVGLPGEAVRIIEPPPGNCGMAKLSAAGPCNMTSYSLDFLLGEDVPDVVVLKIDVEGWEPKVLAAAHDTLEAAQLIAMEAQTSEALDRQRKILEPYGFAPSTKAYCWTPTHLWSK